MLEVVSLQAEKRKGTGKGVARTLRRAGMVPAIVYGKDHEELRISLPIKELTVQYKKGGFTAILLDIELNNKKHRVLARQVEFHPVTDNIEHVDFIFVKKGAEVKVKIRLKILNEDKSLGMKRGGLLNIVKREVDVMCNADHIPTRIEVDILKLNIGDSLRLTELELPKGVKLLADAQNTVLLTIVGRGGKKTEEEEAEAEKKTA